MKLRLADVKMGSAPVLLRGVRARQLARICANLTTCKAIERLYVVREFTA